MATVVEALPNAMFRLRLEDGSERLAHVAGNLRMGFTRLLAGDIVRIDLSPLDASKARIIALAVARQR
jgi:translation initiation factor IF-1